MDDSAQRVPLVQTLTATGPLRRFGLLPGLLCRRVFAQVRVDPGAIEHIRGLAARGSIVYVMRHRSLVDFMLVAFILLREGLPMPEFVSDVPTLVLRPLREIVSTLWQRVRAARMQGKELRHFEDRDRCQRLVSARAAGADLHALTGSRHAAPRESPLCPAARTQRHRLPARDRARRACQ